MPPPLAPGRSRLLPKLVDDLHQRLISIARAGPSLMDALAAVRALGLPDACIGAGTVRNAVWDALYGPARVAAGGDVDVVFFDPTDVRPQRDDALERQLREALPGIPWEVTNQAGVHLWFEQVFGHPVRPLRSIEDAIASWPETATAVALRLEADGALTVIAPLGLQDLFDGIVRRNPARVSIETYRQRIADKRYAERWPGVRVVPA